MTKTHFPKGYDIDENGEQQFGTLCGRFGHNMQFKELPEYSNSPTCIKCRKILDKKKKERLMPEVKIKNVVDCSRLVTFDRPISLPMKVSFNLNILDAK